jgi:hypothetical protein
MTGKDEPSIRGIESRFRDLSVDVREERLVRYIVHQVASGRHVKDIINDAYVMAHFDEVARSRIIEHPEVIKGIEEQIRREFAKYGDKFSGLETGAETGAEERAPSERTDDAELPDL